MADQEINIVCIKWGVGYPVVYTNILFRAVRDKLKRPHNFVCITDDPEGLAPGIKTVDIPDFPLPRALWNKGMWPKLVMFSEGMFPKDSIILYLDVDLVLLQDLEPFLDLVAQKRGLQIIREWNPALLKILPVSWRPDRGGNSSVVGFIAGEQTQVLEDFLSDPKKRMKHNHNDQIFITRFAKNCRYWPHPWCESFKRSCVFYFPLNLIFRNPKKPKNAKIIVFHGEPNPEDLVREDNSRWGTKRKFGFGPVAWVKEYWERHST